MNDKEENPLTAALRGLKAHPEAEWLLHELWDRKSPVRDLLMNHRETLFPSLSEVVGQPLPAFFEVRLPFMVCIGRIPRWRRAAAEKAPLDQIATTEGPGEDVEDDAPEFFDIGKVRMLILHIFVKLARQNKALGDLVTRPSYDFETLLRETKGGTALDFGPVVEEVLAPMVQEFAPGAIVAQPVDGRALHEAKKALRDLFEGIFTDSNRMWRQFAEMTGYLGMVHQVARELLPRYLRRVDMTAKGYQAAVMELFQRGFLESYGHGWTCTKCGPEQVLTAGVNSSFDLRAHSQTCPGCGNEMEWCILGRLCDELWEAVNYKDGLIAIAIADHLLKRGEAFAASVALPNGECDLVIGKSPGAIAVELKMLRHPKAEMQTEEFAGAVEQALSARSETRSARGVVLHNCTRTAKFQVMGTEGRDGIEVLPYLDLAAVMELQA